MSMDQLMDADNKPYVSSPISVQAFRDRALAAEKALSDFFNKPATSNLMNLKDMQTHLPPNSGFSADQLPKEEEIAVDCRTGFKFFLNSQGTSFDAAEEVISSMDETLQDLLVSCPIDQMRLFRLPKDSKLKTHKVLHQILAFKDLYSFKSRYLVRGKYFDYKGCDLKREYVETGKNCEEDVIMIAHLCPGKPPNDNSRLGRLKSEAKMLIRGDTPLTKLRDKIFCSYDYFSNKFDFEDATNEQDYYLNRYPSSFLFIHDTFYIDMRNPRAQDISANIRALFEKKKHTFGPAKVKDMASVKIKDLVLRLGQPYLYMHIGDCEHLIIFTDLRTLHPTDVQEPQDYPIYLNDKYSSPKCSVCKNTGSSFIITESDRIPLCPAFMCTQCFNEFHYDGDRRIGQFKAFHYIDQLIVGF